jgi:hypothetical protein
MNLIFYSKHLINFNFPFVELVLTQFVRLNIIILIFISFSKLIKCVIFLVFLLIFFNFLTNNKKNLNRTNK